MGDSFSLRLDSRPGRRLLSRVMQHVRMQTAAIIMDPQLNSQENILINAYQIFCFVAVKLNHQVMNLPNRKNLSLIFHLYFSSGDGKIIFRIHWYAMVPWRAFFFIITLFIGFQMDSQTQTQVSSAW